MVEHVRGKSALGLLAWVIVTLGLNLAGVMLRNALVAWIGILAVLVLAAMAVMIVLRQDQARQRETSLTHQVQARTAELEKQAAHLTALNETAYGLSSPLRLDEVLLQGAERVKKALGADAVHIHLVNEEGQTLNLETAVGAPVSFLTEESTIGVGECVCGQVAHTSQPIMVADIRNDPRVTRVACMQHGYCTVASVPLRSQDRALGVLTVQTFEPRPDNHADMELLAAIGSQLGVAIENAQLYGEMEKRVQQMTRRLEHLAIVQERERISREIHDGVAQALALLNLRVGMAQSLLAAGQTDQVRKELSDAAQVIDAANLDVREAITALRLTSPKGAEFVPMLKEFVLDFGMRNDIHTEFTAIDGTGMVILSPLIEVQLMRIIQEALTNVRKHASAQHASVTLDKYRQRLRVTIQDDGQGFDMDAVLYGQNRKNFGMTTMRERAEAIGGGLDILTLLGSGTRVTVTVPIDAVKEA